MVEVYASTSSRRMVGPRRREEAGRYSVSVKLPIWNASVMTLNW